MKHRKKWKSYIETIKSFLFIFSIVGLKPSYLTTTKKNRFFGGLEIHAFKRWRNLNLSLSPESPPFRRKERQQQQRHVFSFAWPIWDFFAKTVGVGMLGHFLRGSKLAPPNPTTKQRLQWQLAQKNSFWLDEKTRNLCCKPCIVHMAFTKGHGQVRFFLVGLF